MKNKGLQCSVSGVSREEGAEGPRDGKCDSTASPIGIEVHPERVKALEETGKPLESLEHKVEVICKNC